MCSENFSAMSFSSEPVWQSPPPEPYYPNEKEKIKAYAKEAIRELLEDEEFIGLLKEKLKGIHKEDES